VNIRNLSSDDLVLLRKIYERYFQGQFKFPDFLHGFVNNFVVLDDSNRIVVAGGVKPILECVLITDMNRTPRERHEALLMALEASIVSAHSIGHNQLHCFIQDDYWSKLLKKRQFKPIVGEGLVLNF
jgi:hypothetical protein